jgi:hypothetical protein
MRASPTRHGKTMTCGQSPHRPGIARIVNPPTIFFLKSGIYKFSPNIDDWLDALFLGASDNFFSALCAFFVIKNISSIITLFDNDTIVHKV